MCSTTRTFAFAAEKFEFQCFDKHGLGHGGVMDFAHECPSAEFSFWKWWIESFACSEPRQKLNRKVKNIINYIGAYTARSFGKRKIQMWESNVKQSNNTLNSSWISQMKPIRCSEESQWNCFGANQYDCRLQAGEYSFIFAETEPAATTQQRLLCLNWTAKFINSFYSLSLCESSHTLGWGICIPRLVIMFRLRVMKKSIFFHIKGIRCGRAEFRRINLLSSSWKLRKKCLHTIHEELGSRNEIYPTAYILQNGSFERIKMCRVTKIDREPRV